MVLYLVGWPNEPSDGFVVTEPVIKHSHNLVALQSLSRVQFFVSPVHCPHQAPLSSAVPQSLLKFMSTQSMMLSSHLILCCPLLLPSIFPSIRVFFNDLALCIRWLKYWNFSISPSNEYSGLISFRIDWLIFLVFKGLSRVFSNTTVRKHQFFSAQPKVNSYLTKTSS